MIIKVSKETRDSIALKAGVSEVLYFIPSSKVTTKIASMSPIVHSTMLHKDGSETKVDPLSLPYYIEKSSVAHDELSVDVMIVFEAEDKTKILRISANGQVFLHTFSGSASDTGGVSKASSKYGSGGIGAFVDVGTMSHILMDATIGDIKRLGLINMSTHQIMSAM